MRISGVNIPDNKRSEIALTYIKGIGRALATNILNSSKIENGKKAKDLTSVEVNKIQALLEKYQIEGELHQTIRTNINRLKNIKSYRGSRHTHGLPARGQRTKTNSRTIRGNIRKTAGSGKRKTELK